MNVVSQPERDALVAAQVYLFTYGGVASITQPRKLGTTNILI